MYQQTQSIRTAYGLGNDGQNDRVYVLPPEGGAVGLGDISDFITGSGTGLILAAGAVLLYVWMTGSSTEKRKALRKIDKEYAAKRKRVKDDFGFLGLKGGSKGVKQRRNKRQQEEAKEGGWLA